MASPPALYYLSSGGEVSGPFPMAVVDRMLREGRAPGDAQVCPAGGSQWSPAAAAAAVWRRGRMVSATALCLVAAAVLAGVFVVARELWLVEARHDAHRARAGQTWEETGLFEETYSDRAK